MNLYHWYSRALRNYSSGDILVMAESPEQAKEKARAQIGSYLKDDKSWWFNEDGTINVWSTEDYVEFLKTFEEDIAMEPTQLTEGVLFLRGSE